MAWDQEATEATTDFDSTTGTPTATTDSVKTGTNGFEFDVAADEFGTFTDPTGETLMHMEMWFNPNGITLDDGKDIRLMVGDNGAFPVNMFYRRVGSNYGIIYRTLDDAGATVLSPSHVIGNAAKWHHIRHVFSAATSMGADDGFYLLFVAGALVLSTTGFDNDTRAVDTLTFGARFVDASASGTVYMDDCKWANTAEPWPVPYINHVNTQVMVF